MDLEQYLKQRIDLTKIEKFQQDDYELALVRYVLKEMAPLFYRNRVFFMEEEQMEERNKIYQQKINPQNITCFEIVCSSYCDLIKQVLENQYGLKIELIPTDHDVFKHIALLVVTKKGNRYLIDPLMDLTEMKVSMKTHNFATEEKSQNPFMKTKIEELSFLNSETLEKIDEVIGYSNNHQYTDDSLVTLKKRIHKSKLISNQKRLTIKIISFFEIIRKQKTIKGIVDLIIYVKSALKLILTKQELTKVQIVDFFVDACNLKDKDLQFILEGDKMRKRGLVLSFNKTYIIFSSINTKYKMLNQKEWEEKRNNNNIFVKKREWIKTYQELTKLDLEPNILNHREFLTIFSHFEKKIIQDGKNPKDYIKVISREKIIMNYDIEIEITIQNNQLIVNYPKCNLKYEIDYRDEGRNVVYKQIIQRKLINR